MMSKIETTLGPTKLTGHDLLRSKHLLLHLFPHFGWNKKVVRCSLIWLKVQAEGVNWLIEVIVGWRKWPTRELLREKGGIGSREGRWVGTCVGVVLCGWERLGHGVHGEGVGVYAIVLPSATCSALLTLAELWKG